MLAITSSRRPQPRQRSIYRKLAFEPLRPAHRDVRGSAPSASSLRPTPIYLELAVPYNSAMSLHRLARHPDTPSTAIERIEVELGGDARCLRLSYRMIGNVDRVVAAPLAPGSLPRSRDELWRSTCCELFLRSAVSVGYREYNFAPCGDWAAYGFSGYRSGKLALEIRAPRIAVERSPGALEVTVELTDLPLHALEEAQGIGLACVVETPMELSYWALAHPPGKPDFHHETAFALTSAIDRTGHSGA
jgi:hypothetical protein